MTREVMQQALVALENSSPDQYPEDAGVFYDAITALKAALEQQPVQEPTDIAALVEGMEVSIDVSTGEHDSDSRLFGVVTLAQENQGSKHGLILLIQDAKPNFQPAPPVQGPVACRFCHSKKGCWAWQCYHCGEIDDVQQPAAQPVQEPVAWMSSDRAWMWSDYSKAIAAVANIPTLTLIPLYAAPPQPVQEPLTDEQVKKLLLIGPVYAPDGVVTRTPFAYREELFGTALWAFRKAEAAHGIKETT
jgi:hypothetical protein